MKSSKIRRVIKRRYLITTIILLLTARGLKAQQVTNFTGSWVRNTEKCDTGDRVSIHVIPIRIVVDQGKEQTIITRTAVRKNGDTSSYTEKVKFDGSAGNSIVNPGLNKHSSGAWSADHKKYIETADYADDQGKPIQKVKETWALSEDGKVLTIEAMLVINDSDYETTEVFDKN